MLRDLIWATRWLSKHPFFCFSAVSILALGIGAATAMFSIVDAVLLRPLPYRDPAQLVRIGETTTKRSAPAVPAADYLRWRDRNEVFEGAAAYLRDTVTVTGGGLPEQVFSIAASGSLFSLLGTPAGIGRTLLESDSEPGAPKVAVISDSLWQRRFQRDPNAVGRTLTISGDLFTVVGVMPRQFSFPLSGIDLWTPLHLTPELRFWLDVVARLKLGVTPSQAAAALDVVARRMEQENPETNAGLKIAVTNWVERADPKYEQTLVLVLAAVALVLLIACADVGALLLSRAVQRQKEIAIRASLGAGTWRVARQLLAESVVLVAAATGAGIAIAYGALEFLSARLNTLPIVLPHLERVALNERVLLFNALLGALLVIFCGLAPVLLASRTDLQGALRGPRSGGANKGSNRLFSILVASEAAFACLLLVGSGLMLRSLVKLQQEDYGFRPGRVLTLRVPVGVRSPIRPVGKYDTRPRQIAYYNEILQRVERIPGIASAAVVNNLPLSGANTSLNLGAKSIPHSARTISPRYFETMGIPLRQGRAFTDADQAGAPGVTIVNERLARELFPGQDAIGRKIMSNSTIVGVVADASQAGYDQPVKAEIYIPIRQFIFGTFLSTVVVRTAGEPLSVAAAVQKEVWAVDPNQPIVKVETMNDVIARSIWRPRFSTWLFSVLSVLAIVLTSAGIYGVVAYTSSLRTREMGIRVALGATRSNVVTAIFRTVLVPLSTGLAVGLAAAFMLSKLLASLLYETSGSDPVAYVSAAALLLLAGAAASLNPAWRAATADPLKALRTE